jgi:hypothetical protein
MALSVTTAVPGGGTHCGFYSFEQCRATVWGIGGFCTRNHSRLLESSHEILQSSGAASNSSSETAS